MPTSPEICRRQGFRPRTRTLENTGCGHGKSFVFSQVFCPASGQGNTYACRTVGADRPTWQGVSDALAHVPCRCRIRRVPRWLPLALLKKPLGCWFCTTPSASAGGDRGSNPYRGTIVLSITYNVLVQILYKWLMVRDKVTLFHSSI